MPVLFPVLVELESRCTDMFSLILCHLSHPSVHQSTGWPK